MFGDEVRRCIFLGSARAHFGMSSLHVLASTTKKLALYYTNIYPPFTMAVSPTIVLPGDEIPKSALPQGTGKKKTLTIGPGLRHIPPDTVTATIAGALVTDNRKNAASIEFNSGRVNPPLPLLPNPKPQTPNPSNTYTSTSPTQATSS